MADHIPVTSQPPWPENHPVEVKGGGEVLGPIDVDALERRHIDLMNGAAQAVARYFAFGTDALTALRQQQEALEEKDAELDLAPHSGNCRAIQSGNLNDCNCWKRKALDNE